jgi:hypothetical protein
MLCYITNILFQHKIGGIEVQILYSLDQNFDYPHMFYDIIYVIVVSNSDANHFSHTYFSLLFQKVIGEIYNRKLSYSNEQV